MATAASLSRSAAAPGVRAGLPFAVGALAVAGASAFLAGWMPLAFSIVTVFLFAGPHNWLELRYFMGRMPARWGRLRGYFLFAFTGIFGLTAVYATMGIWSQRLQWDHATYATSTAQLSQAVAAWNTVFVLWVATLVQLRSRQNPRRDWSWIWPVGFLLIALTWLDPLAWSLILVYAHPLVAFWVLDRELRRSQPEWRPAYHLSLLAVPLLLAVLWWRLAAAPNLPEMSSPGSLAEHAGEGGLIWRIAQHAGADMIKGVSSHLLVATHTFLEMLHYGIWVVVIPLVAYRTRPWKLDVPLARRSPLWRRALLGVLALGVLIVLLLWGCFLVNYPLTRDIYFTVALLHVLAEVPFLLRAL
jgi:hypothetical protein